MRLNRRKNRGSERRRKRPSADASESPPDGSEEREEKPRRSLARSVRALRSEGDADLGSERARERPKARREARKRRRGREATRERRAKLVRAAKAVAADVYGIARALLRWPAGIWMAVAEALGKFVLAAWLRGVRPACRAVVRALRVALAFSERTFTPARGLAVVALAATITLGASQFGNYRAVEVGKPEYTKVEEVAQPPQIAKAMPRSAHGMWVFAIAVASLLVTVFAVWRNYRLARLLFLGGLAVVAISVFTDRPEGLRLGTAGQAYAGAQAVLLGPFWVQLFSGVTLAIVGPLLAVQLRAERAGRHARRPGARTRTRRAPSLRPGVGT